MDVPYNRLCRAGSYRQGKKGSRRKARGSRSGADGGVGEEERQQGRGGGGGGGGGRQRGRRRGGLRGRRGRRGGRRRRRGAHFRGSKDKGSRRSKGEANAELKKNQALQLVEAARNSENSPRPNSKSVRRGNLNAPSSRNVSQKNSKRKHASDAKPIVTEKQPAKKITAKKSKEPVVPKKSTGNQRSTTEPVSSNKKKKPASKEDSEQSTPEPVVTNKR